MVFLDIGHVGVILSSRHIPMSTFYQLTSMRSYMMEDASPVIDIHPNVDILSTHQYEKLYMIEDALGGTQISSCKGVSHSHTYLHQRL